MIRAMQTCGMVWLLVLVFLSRGLLAQAPNQPGLEAIRVFFDEKDVDRVVTPAFIMVSMEELDKRLKEYVEKRSLSAAQDTGIQRATYVARWNEQTLVSRASLLQVATTRAASPLDIGRISVALEEPQGVPESALPLTRQLRYLDDNHLQILSEQNQSDYWFGFKAKTRRRDSGQHAIDLQLPRAVVSTLLVAVPTHSVVTSDLPCAAVNDVSKYLPTGWPSTALPSLNADEQWFAIWLSGQETCTLNFSPANKVKGAANRMLVPSAQSDTQITPAGIQVSSQFRLAAPPAGGKLRLLVEDQLHVRSISVGSNVVTTWKTIYDEPPSDSDSPNATAITTPPGTSNATPRPRARMIEIPCESTDSGLLVVTVDCIGRLSLPYDGALPRVEIDGAYVLDGRCTLLGHERVQIDDCRSTAHVLATSSQNGVAQWQWQWTGKAPSTSALMRLAPVQWTVRALTRLDVQSDVVVASVHANINSSHVQGNQMTLKLADGWFVDSVDLENAPPGVTVDAAGDGSERIIRWDERRTDLDVRVLLKAHYHQRTDVENLRLTSTRIISVPGADQVDTYIVESSGSFRLDLDAELLRMRVREDDLVPWQRALLPRLAEAWIFSAGRAALPPLRLSRTRSTVEAKLHTTVSEDFDKVSASYRVLCKPISGTVKQLKIHMTLPAGVTPPTWSIVDPFALKSRTKLSATSSATNSVAGESAFAVEGETTFTIELSEDVAEVFQVQAELPLVQRDMKVGQAPVEISIPLPRMRQAVSQEAVLVIPQRYRLPTLPSIEILPPGLCCEGGKLESSIDSDVVAVRYDTNAFDKVDLRRESATTVGGWAHTQLHEHWQYRGGRTLHRSTWELASPVSQQIALRIPPNWDVQSLTIDDQEEMSYLNSFQPRRPSDANSDSFNANTSNWQTLQVAVPKSDRVRMQLTCSSLETQPWYRPLVYEQPELPVGAHQSRSVIWFPRSRWATTGWPAVADTWQDRFCPRQWWRLLGFEPGQNGNEIRADWPAARDDVFPELERANQQIVGKNVWWKLEFDEPSPVLRVWTIEQSLAGAISLCLFLLLCIFISVTLGARPKRWLVAWILAGAGLSIAPPSALLPLQMISVALAASTLARLARFTAERSRAAAVKRHDSMLLSKSLLSKTGVASLLVIAALMNTSAAFAQPFKSGVKDKREVFAILIPVDESYKVAGEHVYISPRLYGLLKDTDQKDNKPREVSIGNVIYSLSISNDLVNSTNTVGDVTVEFNVQATLPDSELRLPFVRSEASLVRAVLDLQPLVLGDRIRQESDGVVWRAGDSERHALRITLRPRALSQRDGRGQLSLAIPAIPSARLEVQSDNLSDLREVQVDTVGGIQSETFRTLSARLGPVNRLNVSWPLNSDRGGPTQVQSDTWIHARGDKVMAMCQLRMRGASNLAASLSIAGDGNWMPVGQEWEDFRMLGSEGASPVGKPIYNVEKLENRNSDELTLRVLMLPKDETANSLTIPFLSMQPLVSVSRTLAFSYTDSPKWKSVGTDWQPLFASQAAQLWDGMRLADQPTLWRVPAGTVQGTLQRITPPNPPSVDEVTEVQLLMPETKVKYLAKWATPLIGPSAVRLQIPNSLKLENVLVGAMKARYAIHRIAGSTTTSELVVFIDSGLGGIESLNLQFSSPTRLNKPVRIPRPLLMESAVRSSAVQIYRGVELTSTHAVVDGSGLEMESLDVRESQLLQELQTPIGRLELGDRLRESPELPLEFTLARTPATRAGKAVLRLTRNEQGWRGQLDAMPEVRPGEINHLFFDIPRSLESSLREPLESNAAMTLWPSPDSNRLLLSVLPSRESSDHAHISFAFRLPSSGVSQTINIPDIRLLGISSPRPALALPVEVAGEAVRWTGVGRPLAANWLREQDAKRMDLSAFELYEPLDNQTQAVWHSREQRDKDAQVLLTSIELPSGERWHSSSTSAQSLRGTICYWLAPHDHPYVDFDLPATCRLIGLEANDRPSSWLEVSKGRVRVLLQPSYLPSRLRLLVRWSGMEMSSSGIAVKLPRPLALITGPVLIRHAGAQASSTDVDKHLQLAGVLDTSVETVEAMQAQAWANMLTQAAPTAAGRGNDEMTAWLPSWDPQWLGLDSATPVSVRRQALVTRPIAEDENNEEIQLPVAEFWSEFLKQNGLENYSNVDAEPDAIHSRSPEMINTIKEFRWQQMQLSDGEPLDSLVLQTGTRGNDSDVLARWAIGIGWILLLVLVPIVATGGLRSVCTGLGELLWPLWFVLALAAAALLPVLWPAIVVSLGMFVVLVRRYRQLRRDRQFVLMPKALR